ncbi:MAG: tetratricopeptide repeat protein [Cyanobacteria bacterium]|nr:tetratricopeptide repeat protein [Cyanobacteriota bacterium]
MAQPYISRPETDAFLDQLATALESPQSHPVVFQAWGIGGVGKSTLTRKVQAKYGDSAHSAAVSFGQTEGIEDPIPLMAKLYGQMVPQDDWAADPFWTQHSLYFDTIHQLQTQAATGRGVVEAAQVGHVQSLLRLGVDVAGEWFLSESAKKATQTVVTRGMEAAVAGLSLKDELMGLLQQHKATKRNQALQRLMLEPLPQLTQAFVAGLTQQSQQRPVIVVLDTYEKVPSAIDTWLWRTLLGNTDLARQRVRLVVAGRHCVLRTEGWRKLHQDRDAVYECTIERFDREQTQQYLAQIDITDAARVDRIFTVTRGLPYYLNWIREQTERGRSLDFDQGNQEIARLLLQGLNPVQTQVVQLAACCRWFDAKIIRHMTEQQGLDFAAAVDEERNCYGWLTQLSFAEPVGKRWRLDDVARDVFRQSLGRDQVEAIHGVLADYYLALSNQEVPPNSPYLNRYQNPDWCGLRAEYLYHLLFTRRDDIQPQFATHLFEGCYLSVNSVTQLPLTWMTAEADGAETSLLTYATRTFLKGVKPAVEHSYLVFEWYGSPQQNAANSTEAIATWKQLIDTLESPTGVPAERRQQISTLLATLRTMFGAMGQPIQDDAQLLAVFKQALPLIEENPVLLQMGGSIDQQAEAMFARLGYSLEDIEAAITVCFSQTEALDGLGRCVALIYQARRSPSERRADLLLSALAEAQKIKAQLSPGLGSNLLWGEIGVALGNLGRYEEAIAAYDAALAIKPDKHEALNNKGIALGNLGRYEEAIAAYDAALAIKPDDHQALNNKGIALVEWAAKIQQEGNTEEALAKLSEGIAAYDAALAIKPDYHEALNNKGIALRKLGHYEEAIAAYDAALAIKPDYHEALNNKGIALGNLGRYEEAIAAYDAALAIKPDDHEALNNKGNALGNLGRYEDAIAAYDAALQIKPDDPSPFYNKACAYALQGLVEPALENLAQAIHLNPDKYREMAKTDTDFEAIRGNPHFQALLHP